MPSRWPSWAPLGATTSTPCSPSSWSARARPVSRWRDRSPSSPTAPCARLPSINTRHARVILSTPPTRCCRRSARSWVARPSGLERLGVEVLLGAMVTELDERGHHAQPLRTASRERIAAVTKVWAAGVQAVVPGRTLSEQTGAPLDRAGRIGSTRPHPAGPPGGLRRRRHDRPRPSARRRAGGHPGRAVRREGDRPPAGGQTGRRTVPLPRTRARWRSSRGSGRWRWSAGSG